jgi:ABC-type antimicrobial peptide transport system permease subunit
MPDIATLAPAVEQEKATASKPVGIRPRQGSGSRLYANFSSAISLLRTWPRYGIQAIAAVFSAAMLVMVTYILLYHAHSLFQIHLNAQIRMLMLASISGVSFAAGGLMLMKVLLTVGRERSREFAIRMVVGARRSDVRSQLLFEVLLLSVAGGISGNGCGLCISFVLTLLLQLPFSVNPVHLLLLISASFVPGIVYGLYAVQRILGQDFAKVLRS